MDTIGYNEMAAKNNAHVAYDKPKSSGDSRLITGLFDEQEQQLELLLDTVVKLNERLYGILQPEYPQSPNANQANASAPESPKSPVSSRLQETNMRIANMRQMLSSIMDRLEI